MPQGAVCVELEDMDDTDSRKSRKRKRCPEQWKDNIRKKTGILVWPTSQGMARSAGQGR